MNIPLFPSVSGLPFVSSVVETLSQQSTCLSTSLEKNGEIS